MKLKKRAASLLTAGALLAVPLVGVDAASANAEVQAKAGFCLSTAIPADKSSGVFRLKKTLPLQKGPYSDCDDGPFALEGRKFYLWCYATNAYGNMWYYGREEGTQDKGWVYIGNVTFLSGTVKECPGA